jgi:dolichol-phosphate mannosyltransferase
MVRLGAHIREIPIVFRKREHDTSKSTLKDIIESLRVTGILRLRTLKEWRLLKVVAIGGTGFLLQTFIFELLGFWLGIVRPSTAVIIGGEAAILSNFLLNNRFSFKDKVGEASSFLTRFLRFHIIALGSVFIQWGFVRGFEILFGYHQLLLSGVYILAVVVGLGVTYTGYYFWVWRKKN